MNRAQSRKIERILCSLQQSTDLTVSLRGETVQFDGLNSPYDSHCTVRVTEGHGIPQLVIFRNGRHSLAVIPGGEFPRYHHEIEGDYFKTPFPAFHFFDLFMFPAKRPRWFEGVVTLVVPDRFQGFNNEGEPQFKPSLLAYLSISCRFYHPTYQQEVTWETEIVSRPPWEEVGKIANCKSVSTLLYEGNRYWNDGTTVYEEGVPFRNTMLRNCQSLYYEDTATLLKAHDKDLFPLCHWVKCDEQCGECKEIKYWWVITPNLANPPITPAIETKIREVGGEIE